MGVAECIRFVEVVLVFRIAFQDHEMLVVIDNAPAESIEVIEATDWGGGRIVRQLRPNAICRSNESSRQIYKVIGIGQIPKQHGGNQPVEPRNSELLQLRKLKTLEVRLSCVTPLGSANTLLI